MSENNKPEDDDRLKRLTDAAVHGIWAVASDREREALHRIVTGEAVTWRNFLRALLAFAGQIVQPTPPPEAADEAAKAEAIPAPGEARDGLGPGLDPALMAHLVLLSKDSTQH